MLNQQPPKVYFNMHTTARLSPRHLAASATGTTSFEITFEGYSGDVEALVVDTNQLTADSETVVSAEVTIVQEGTEPLLGDFTLGFQGQETPALSADASADEVSRDVLICCHWCRRCCSADTLSGSGNNKLASKW